MRKASGGLGRRCQDGGFRIDQRYHIFLLQINLNCYSFSVKFYYLKKQFFFFFLTVPLIRYSKKCDNGVAGSL